MPEAARVSEHHACRVGPPSDRYVTRATGYHYEGGPPGEHVGLPSGTLTLVVPLGQPLVLSDAHRPRPTAYAAVLAGLATGPTTIHHDGTQVGLQLALTPAGARAVLGLPASELAERSVELEDVVGAVGASLREEVESAASWPERWRALERVLARLVDRRRTSAAAPELGEAWRLLRGGPVPVAAVAREVGWSRRHLEHRFLREFGVTPKAASSVARFERSVAVARDPAVRLADVAAACGYADQAHLAREWRRLAGRPPSRWRVEDALAFVQDEGPRDPTGSSA